MKKNKVLRYLIIAVVALLLFAIIGKKAGWIGKENATKVSVEEVSKRTIIETVAANGKVQPEIEVKISPDVSGEIIELYVKEGQEVKKGDLLVKINPDIYVSMVNRMNASLNTSRANLANSQARHVQAKTQLSNAEVSYNRNKKLYDQGAISASEFDAATASYENAKAEVEASNQTVIASEFNIKSAEASLKEASDNLSRTTIFSPVNGTISMLNIEKGERVVGTSQMAGTEIMRIANLNEMEVSVEVNENDIVRLSVGDTSLIEVDAYLGRKFKGLVTEIANSANTTGTSADQVTNFAVKIRILQESYKDLIPKGQPNLSPFRPGMSATVDIQTQTVFNVLAAPINAITTRQDTSGAAEEEKEDFGREEMESEQKVKEGNVKKKEADTKKEMKEVAFVYKDGKAILKVVKTGIQDDQYIEILDGLTENDKVITGPYRAVSKKLKNKSSVKEVEEDELYKDEKDE